MTRPLVPHPVAARPKVSRLVAPDGMPLNSLRDINRSADALRRGLYLRLIPDELFARFGIDPRSLQGPDGRCRVQLLCPAELGLVRITVQDVQLGSDPLFFVELADTPFGQVELSFCLINDPASPRFAVDIDSQGRDNSFATLRRNLDEEVRAMAAGLSPHQVRRGLRLFAPFLRRLEELVAGLGGPSIVAEPLSYCNAIRYEQYGFDYIAGKQLMRAIHRDFQPGGDLFRRLDGSSPFRRAGLAQTVRGRSWAIHDGILERPWDGVKIYKTPYVAAGIETFPGRRY